MLLSGPRSYFNDYARKHGLGRALNDPPTLLTDRGAYVNFLEVQLERVCAQCLSVQSYDQKFNDMHTMIVGLEQRCGNTTKLVNIAQQCTLELRNENESKLQVVANSVKGEHYEMRKLLEAMSTRISAAEQVLTGLPSLTARMDTIEARIAKNELDFELYQKSMNEQWNHTDEEFMSLKNVNVAFKADMEKIRAEVSKNTFNIDENDGRMRRCVHAVEETFQEELKTDRDEFSRKYEVLTSNINFQVEKLQADSVSRESGCLSALRLHKEHSAETLDMLKREFTERCDSFETYADSRLKEVNHSVQEGFSSVDGRLVMTGNRISVLSTDFSEYKEEMKKCLGDVDTDIDDLYDSMDEMVAKIGEVAQTADKAAAGADVLVADFSRITEDVMLLDRILGETDENISNRFHELNKQLSEFTSRSFHSFESNRDDMPAVSSPSESEDDHKHRHVDSQGRPILDYIGAGLYSGVGPKHAGKKKEHVNKLVTSALPPQGSSLRRNVSFDPVMRSGSPPAKREKLGYIGSGIYWDRSQPFDKHLVLEMLQDMKDSDSVDPFERAELIYAAQHGAKSPPDDVRARIRAKIREETEEQSTQNDNYISRLAHANIKSGASNRSDNSVHSGISSKQGYQDEETQRRPSTEISRPERRPSRSAPSSIMSTSDPSQSTKVNSNLRELPPKSVSPSPRRRASMSDVPNLRSGKVENSLSAKAEKNIEALSTKRRDSINSTASSARDDKSKKSAYDDIEKKGNVKLFKSLSSVSASSADKIRSEESAPKLSERRDSTGSESIPKRKSSTIDSSHPIDDKFPSSQRVPFSMKSETASTAKSKGVLSKESVQSSVYQDSVGSIFSLSASSAEEEKFQSLSSRQSSIRNDTGSEKKSTESNMQNKIRETTSSKVSSDHSSMTSVISESSHISLDSIQNRVKSALRKQTGESSSIESNKGAISLVLVDDRDDSDDAQDDDYVYESASSSDDDSSESSDSQQQSELDSELDEGDEANDELQQSRSLMDMSGESSEHVAEVSRRKKSERVQSKRLTKSGRVRNAQRSLSPHLTAKPDYFYLNDILAAEVKAARTNPHNRAPDKPWVPNSSTVSSKYKSLQYNIYYFDNYFYKLFFRLLFGELDTLHPLTILSLA